MKNRLFVFFTKKLLPLSICLMLLLTILIPQNVFADDYTTNVKIGLGTLEDFPEEADCFFNPDEFSIVQGDSCIITVTFEGTNYPTSLDSQLSQLTLFSSQRVGGSGGPNKVQLSYQLNADTLGSETLNLGKYYSIKLNVVSRLINIQEESLQLQIGDTHSLTLDKDASLSEESIIWESNANDIVTVDENGQITAVGYGIATITARGAIHSEYSDTCSISVGNGTVLSSGTCGNNSQFYIYSSGDMIIKGSGTITSFFPPYADEIKHIYIQEGITGLNENAFTSYSNLESVTLPSSVLNIGDYAFGWNPKLTTIEIGTGCKSIGNGAFYECTGLQSVVIPNNVVSLGESAFTACSNLSSVVLSNQLTELKNSTFVDCSNLQDIDIPNSITSIGSDVFWGCSSLADISLPDGLIEINENTFNSCIGLSEIYIPKSVNSIKAGAFYNCPKLATVNYEGTKEEWTLINIEGNNNSLIDANKNFADTPDISNKYTITWKNEDGTVLELDENLSAGDMPSYDGDLPTKASDNQYLYTFSGWSPEIVPVSGNTIYTATYNKELRKYTVTWTADDGTVLKNDEVAYGEIPVYSGDIPTKDEDEYYTYSFDKWEPNIVPVEGDTTFAATFVAQPKSNAITGFHVEDITILEGTHIDFYYDGMEPTSKYWYSLTDQPELLQYSFDYNGEHYTGIWDYYYINDQLTSLVGDYGWGMSINSISPQDENHEWVAGNTYQAKASIVSMADSGLPEISCTFNVTILENKLESIQFNNLYIPENTCGERITGAVDPDMHTEEFYVYDPSQCDSLSMTAIYDGESYTGTVSEVCAQLEELTGTYCWPIYKNGRSEQWYPNNWTVGNTYTAELTFLGIKSFVNVNITDGLLSSLQINDIAILENTCGFPSYSVNPDTGSKEKEFFNYEPYYSPQMQMSVVYDGVEYSGSYYEVCEYLQTQTGEWPYIEFFSVPNQTYEHQWSAGNEYVVTATMLGVKTSFQVSIVETPVAEIHVEDMVILENSHGNISTYWDTEEECNKEYFNYSVYLSNYTVKMKNGNEYTFSNNGPWPEIPELAGFSSDLSIETDQGEKEQWSAGNIYTATARLGGVSTDFQVKIEETPIANVVIENVTLRKGLDSLNNQYPGISITMKSGNNYEISQGNDDIQIPELEKYESHGRSAYYYFSINEEDLQSSYSWAAGSTNIVRATFAGFEATFEVNVIDNPVIGFKAVDNNITLIKNVDGNTYNGFFEYEYRSELNNLNFEVTYRKNNVEQKSTVKLDDLYALFDTGSYSYDTQTQTQWTEAGVKYPVTVTFAGYETTIYVTLIETEESFYDWEAKADELINSITTDGVWYVNLAEPEEMDYATRMLLSGLLPETDSICFTSYPRDGGYALTDNILPVTAFRKYGPNKNNSAAIKYYDIKVEFSAPKPEVKAETDKLLDQLHKAEEDSTYYPGNRLVLEDLELLHSYLGKDNISTPMYLTEIPLLNYPQARFLFDSDYEITAVDAGGGGGGGPVYNYMKSYSVAMGDKDAYYSCDIFNTECSHIVYVPDETPNTISDYMKAAQNRIDAQFGKNKAKITYIGTKTFRGISSQPYPWSEKVCTEGLASADDFHQYQIDFLDDNGDVKFSIPIMLLHDSAEIQQHSKDVHVYDENGVCSICGMADSSWLVSYHTHVQSYGDQEWKYDGAMSGTSGEAKRLEGIWIDLNDRIDGGIEYRTHVQSFGWQDWVSNGTMSGTSGLAKRLEAIQIRLTDDAAEQYDVYYRVHAQHFGWMGWAKNGEAAGTAGYAYRLEGIQIQIVPKSSEAPGSTEFAYRHPLVEYRTHVQSYGWQGYVKDGEMSGTSGQAKRLEGINIHLNNQDFSGSIQYRTHIQTYGWEPVWKRDGAMSGTSGEAKRLEAIQIQLTGEMAKHYDVYYRVHAQHFGWLDWAKNGEAAGTAGFAYRLEGIEIQLIPKGKEAPGKTDVAFIQAITYVLNTSSKRFHESTCGKVQQMSSRNKRFYTGLREDVLAMGYKPCELCEP